MTLNITLSLIGIVLLIGISGFFAGSETALTAVSKASMHHLANEGSWRARQVNALIANRERLIGALLLGNTFVNILASALATDVSLRLFTKGGIVLVTVAMTAIILIFAEVLPKTLAIARTDRMALQVAVPVRLFVAFLAPIVATVQFVVWRLLWLLDVRE